MACPGSIGRERAYIGHLPTYFQGMEKKERKQKRKETDVKDVGQERGKLVRDPNLNQAGNERGSLDQTQGSQTGNEVLPEE